MRLLPVVCLLVSATLAVAQDQPSLGTKPAAPSPAAADDKPVLNRPAETPADDDKPKPVPPVSVPVLVRDHKGGPVTGLTAANFSIKVGDDALKVDAASMGSGAVTYGLVVDVSHGERHALEAERKAAKELIAAMKPGDQMFVVQFAKEIELLSAPTDNLAKLNRALDELGTESSTFKLDEAPHADTDEEGRRIRGGNDVLNDAVFLASDDVLSKQKTKRVLVVMSDGVDQGSKLSMSDALESIERNGVIVYTVFAQNQDTVQQQKSASRNGQSGNNGGRTGGIGFPGSYPGGGGGYPGGGYPGQSPSGGGSGNPNGTNNPNSRPQTEPDRKPNTDGVGALQKLADNTGGRLLDSAKSSGDASLASVTEDMQAMYWLTFVPKGGGARHGYHSFDLQVAGSDKSRKVDVSAPVGYYNGD